MKTWVINALVPVSFTVEAENRDDAISDATTMRRYSMTSPDGERVEINEDDIQSCEPAEEETK